MLIHGGSLAWGSGSEQVHGSPEFIIHQDVIYVTINYRLHILGNAAISNLKNALA